MKKRRHCFVRRKNKKKFIRNNDEFANLDDIIVLENNPVINNYPISFDVEDDDLFYIRCCMGSLSTILKEVNRQPMKCDSLLRLVVSRLRSNE